MARRKPAEVNEKAFCRRCGGPVGLGHQIIGLCSYCIDTKKKVRMKQPNYFRKVPHGGQSGPVI